MSRNEALELHQHPEIIEQESGTKALKQFQAFTAALETYQGAFSVQPYSQQRQAWQPFGSSHTIVSVLEEMIASLHDNAPARLKGRLIKIQHYAFDALLNEEKELRHIYSNIAKSGCIVIVDEFSLFHPKVRTAFMGSQFSNSEQVALVTISPFDPSGLAPNQVLKNALRSQLKVAFDRFSLDYDPKCEFGIGTEHRLKRWLHSNLPVTMDSLRELRPNRRLLEQFTREIGQESLSEYTDLVYSEDGVL